MCALLSRKRSTHVGLFWKAVDDMIAFLQHPCPHETLVDDSMGGSLCSPRSVCHGIYVQREREKDRKKGEGGGAVGDYIVTLNIYRIVHTFV